MPSSSSKTRTTSRTRASRLTVVKRPQQVPLVHRVWNFVGKRFRRKRMEEFLSSFAVTPQTRILDVGGSRSFWRDIAAQVTVVNLDASVADRVADARNLPFANGSFDIVFSNSVIEHVGTWEDQVAYAREIARVGKRYYVQTPNQRFPVEPHFLTPFVHWLPVRWRELIARFTVWGILTRPDKKSVKRYVASIRLLTSRDMAELFPDAVLKYERVLGLNKSLIAQRLAPSPARERYAS